MPTEPTWEDTVDIAPTWEETNPVETTSPGFLGPAWPTDEGEVPPAAPAVEQEVLTDVPWTTRLRMTPLARTILGPTPLEEESMAGPVVVPQDIAAKALEATTPGALPAVATLARAIPLTPLAPLLPAAAMSLGISPKLAAIPQAVEQGLKEAAINFPLTPLPGIKTAAGRAALAAFGAQFLASQPEQLKAFRGAMERGDYVEATRIAAGEVAMAAGLAVGGKEALRHGEKPPALPTKEPEKGPEYASSQEKAAEVYGDVRAQPVAGVREVPLEEGRPGVQPQAEGRIPETEIRQVPEAEPGRVLLKPVEQSASLEAAAIDDWLNQHPAAGGKVPARKPYSETREEAFAKAFNDPKVSNEDIGQQSSSLVPKMEDARHAIETGLRLGYAPNDISAYLVRNYVRKYSAEAFNDLAQAGKLGRPTPQPKVTQIEPSAAEPSQPTPGLPATPGEKAIPQEPTAKISPTEVGKQIATPKGRVKEEVEKLNKYAAGMVQSAGTYIRRSIEAGKTPKEAAIEWGREIGKGMMDTPDDIYRRERGGLYSSSYVKGILTSKEGVAANAKEFLKAVDQGRQEGITWKQQVIERQKTLSGPPGPGAKTAGEPPYAAAQLLTDQLKATQATTTKDAFSARERLADTWAEGKTLFERAVGRTRATAESLKDVARGVRDVTDLDRRVGELDWLLQKSAGQSRNMGKAIEKQQPSKVTRDAVALWIDAGGDVGKLRETLASLPAGTHPSVRRALERAIDLPPEGMQFAQQLEQFYGIRLQDARESEIFEKALDDYYTHIWQRQENMPEKLRTAYANGRVSDYFQFARQRKLPTFLDGILQGKRPVLDPAKVLPFYNYALDRAIASRKFVKELSEIDAPDGRPVVLPMGTARRVEGEAGGIFINPKGKGELGKDYRTIDHPAMRKWKWLGTDENGNPVMYFSNLGANPLVARRLSRMLDQQLATPSPVGRVALRVSGEVKAAKLAAIPSFFHQAHVGSHALWHWTLPFKVGEIDWEAPMTRLAVEKGHLKLAGDAAEISNFSEVLGGQGLVHKVPIVGPWAKAYSEYLFSDWIPKLKLKTFENAYARNIWARDNLPGKLTGLKGLTDEQIAARIGDSVNNAYGELNHWFIGQWGRSPQLQRIFRAVFLAPDFGEARLRFLGKAFSKAGMEERIAFATMVTAMYFGARVANMISHGDPEGDLKNAFRVKVKLPGQDRMEWLSMRSVAGDVVHAWTGFGQFMYVRLNPLYARTFTDVLFKRDVYGRALSNWDTYVKRPLQQLVPINFTGLTRDDADLWESFITSMGLQTRHDVPALDIGKLKRQWLLDNPDPKLKAMGQRADAEIFPPSDYGPLRRALFNNELGDAREAYEKLKTDKGKKAKDIAEAIRPYSGGKVDASGTYQPARLKPIGGLISAADERKFYSTLTKSEKALYAQALAERKRIWQRFQEMLAKQ